MSRPEPSDNIVRSDHASRGSGEFYRLGRASAAEGEEPFAKGDLSRLRQSLGPQPEVVHVPQPTRRLGWFAAGFVIALAVGVVLGWLAIAGLPSLTGKAPAPTTKTAELTAKSENSKSPEATANGVAAAPAAPQAIQSSTPATAAPVAAPAAQPANGAPARLATIEPGRTVRGVTDSHFGLEFRRRSAVQPRNSART